MSIATNVTKALTAATSYGEAIKALKADCAKLTRDAGRAAMLPAVAAFYSVPVVDGAGKAEGTKVLDKTAAKYEAAKKALQRLVADVFGKAESSSHKAQAKAPAKLAQAIIAQVIAAGISKAEFVALLAAVRDGVSFE